MPEGVEAQPPRGDRSQSGSDGHSGERRLATVLFADLAGFTAFSERAGEEAAFSLMRRISALMTEAIHAQAGTVKTFTGDGVMALFGVPRALEDAPLRACRAALDIQQRIVTETAEIEKRHGLRPQMRIGINIGPMIVGEVESGESTNVTAIGDTVNLASRLEGLAEPGTVVLSEAVHRLVHGLVDASDLGEHRMKGKAEAQRVFRLDGLRKGAARFDAALSRGLTVYVGRERELEMLKRGLDEASDQVRAVDIAGEAGIGKSRLLYEFRQRLGKERAFVLSGSCSPDGQQTPFLPFIEVVRGSFRLAPGEVETAVARKLDDGLKALGLSTPRNLALLLNLLSLKVPEGALDGLDGTLIGFQTRDLLLQLLASRCRLSRVILLIEDLHWIDSVSAELLGRIVAGEGSAALLVLHTRRPEYRPPWSAHPNVTPLTLEPLSAIETQRIVQARLEAGELPQAIGRLVAERAEGNALFAEEIASFLLERGIVRRAASELEYDVAAVATALPATVQSVLAARVDRLAPEDRALLQTAAVVGRRFDPSLLAAVIGAADVEGRLTAMQELDLVRRDGKSEACVFKHALVRDGLYDSLLTDQRSGLHLEIATEIERRSANRLTEVAETLAYHYGSSVRADKAFQYSSMAGRKSLDIYSLDEAASHFRNALRLLDANPGCADDVSMADAVADLMQCLYLMSKFPDISRLAERYMSRLEGMGNTPQLVYCLYYYGCTLGTGCDFRACEAICARALHIARQLGSTKAVAYARQGWFWARSLLARDSLEVAEREGYQLVADCESANDNYILSWAYNTIALDYLYRGLTNDARDWCWKLINAGRERADRRALGMAYWTLSWIDLFTGRYDEAITDADACIDTAVAPLDRKYGATAKAVAAMLRGHAEQALSELQELRHWARDDGVELMVRAIDGYLGAALVLTGRIGEGIRLLERWIAAADASGIQMQAVSARVILAEVYLQMLGRWQTLPRAILWKNVDAILGIFLFGARRARTLLEEAGRLGQLHDRGSTLAQINMDLGLLYKLRKQPTLAREFLEKARGPADLQGATVMLGTIDAALADLAHQARP